MIALSVELNVQQTRLFTGLREGRAKLRQGPHGRWYVPERDAQTLRDFMAAAVDARTKSVPEAEVIALGADLGIADRLVRAIVSPARR